MQTREWDAVVVGGGTAGLSAAQMLGRARRRTLVLDEGHPRNRFAAHMHGVLGHDGLPPDELLARGRHEAAAYGVAVEVASVIAVEDLGERLRVIRADGSAELARTLIVTTGLTDALPAVEGLTQRWGIDVLHCPYCHGWEVAGARLGVLATSSASLHQIELVRQWSDDVIAFTALAEPLDAEVAARLHARGIRTVSAAVVSVESDGDGLRAAITVDGDRHPLDALFVAPDPVIDLGFVEALALVRSDLPGGPLAVDERGATSHPRVFAAGNVVAPYANVPVSMGTGSMAGAGAGAALVTEDAARALATARADAARRDAWEERYSSDEHVWSGRVNATLAAVVGDLPADGTALDIGCGEGGDAIWLAERGWRVTGLDLSETAVRRASAAARERGLDDGRASFVAGDAASASGETVLGEATFDLVTTSFLHSWEADFPRIALLRAAADRVAPGGRLLVLSHAAAPPWASAHSDHVPELRGPAEELALLDLDPARWEVEIVEVRPRETLDPDGDPARLEDGVLLLRRR
ncbi:MAG TPA: bifunctional NAD(P)/FAD-dependent oxidoreductase/class I SAM-dependent methyltransferase [Microbacterium sp.]|nr:bifunctional NAD(P)/FAD-dependent oxidoreductase/class I SAM-dependent methyltransferase [Microbacterium sp.]